MKYLLLCLLMTLTSMAVAQKIDSKALQGNWKLTSFNASGINLDVTTGDVTLTKDFGAPATPELLSQIKESMSESLAQFRSAYLKIAGNNFSQTFGPETSEGTYSIIEKNGNQYLALAFIDGLTDEAAITLVNKQLHVLINDQGETSELVYAKE
jgi:hypothetical protein